ncbi:MAG: hypothetical protein ACAI37_03305 [Chthoniobacter sp.]
MGILGGWIIYYEPFGNILPVVTWAVAVVALLFHGWGCYNYVTGKGHTALLAIIGLAPLAIFLSGVIPGYRAPAGCILLIPLGLLLLAILPDHTVQSEVNKRAINYHQQNSRFAPPPPPPKSRWAGVMTTAVIIATFAILGFIGYRSVHSKIQTVEEAQRLAVQQYPALKVADSSLNREFRARYRHYQATNQAYFNDKEWPLHLAAESQAALDQTHAGR